MFHNSKGTLSEIVLLHLLPILGKASISALPLSKLLPDYVRVSTYV